MACRMLFASSLLLWNRFLNHRIGLFSQEQQVCVADVPVVSLKRISGFLSSTAALRSRIRVFTTTPNLLLIHLFNESRFAQVISIAEGMDTPVVQRVLSAVMDAGSLKTRQDANRLQCLLAAFGMNLRVGGPLSGAHIQPLSFPLPYNPVSSWCKTWDFCSWSLVHSFACSS
jgi:hypothetical protein